MEVIDVDALPDVENTVTDSAEAAVVIKQEKTEEHTVVPESEKKLISCFCPHGYSTATSGHYHCRHCGHSSRYLHGILRHEKKGHKSLLEDKAKAGKEPAYSCRHCGFLSHYAMIVWQHEKQEHAKSGQLIDKQEAGSQSKKSRAGTGIMLQTAASTLRRAQKSRMSRTLKKTISHYDAADSEKLIVCRCSKGFRSVTGQGHWHCRCCRKSFRYRHGLFHHEELVHGKAAPDSVDTSLNDSTSSSSVKKGLSQCQSLNRSEGKKYELSPKDKNAGDHCQNIEAHDSKCQDTKISPAGSVSVEAFPPFKSTSKNKIKESDSCDGKSDSQKYATQVTVCTDGKEVISRIPCYSGNVVFPTMIRRSRKERCPICNMSYSRIETLRNHVISVHNIIRSGETVYSCIPCKYKTSNSSSFTGHCASYMHRSNLDQSVGNGDSRKAKPQPHTSLTVFPKQRAGWFYSSAASNLDWLKFGNTHKQPPLVVWQGHLNHLCSSQCLHGLITQQSSADEIASGSRKSQRSQEAQATKVPTAVTSVDTSKESRKLRNSSDTHVQGKVTARKSTTQPLNVAFKFAVKKKETPVLRSMLKTVETSEPKSVGNEGTSEKTITIIDSESDSEDVAAVKNSQSVMLSSNSNRKRTSPRVTKPTKPSTSSADKRKDSLSSKSENTGGFVKAQCQKSTCAVDSHRTEASQVRSSVEDVAAVENFQSVMQSSNSNGKRVSPHVTKPSTSSAEKRKESLSSKSGNSGSFVKAQCQRSASAVDTPRTEASSVKSCGANGDPGVITSSQQTSCKSTTSAAIKTPLVVPVSAEVSVPTFTSSARSVPVIGVAKAVPAVTTMSQATTSSNRSLYSLHRFSAETLWSELCRRGGMRSCDCGVSFMDSTLYLLHRSCHSDLAPLKCAFCDHKSASCYDFHAHLLDHKK